MLNPEFWLDEEIAKLSPHARLLYMGLWGICDDNYATFPNRPEWVRAQVFPYEPEVDINSLLLELETLKKIVKFVNDGKEFWYIKNFLIYQKIDHPSLPKFPPHPDFSRGLTEGSPRARSQSNRIEVKLSKVKRKEVILHSEETSQGKEINNIINLFKSINPSYERLFKNKTQRSALERLVNAHGLEKIISTIGKLPELVNQKYAPRITTPIQLEDKLGELIIFFNQHKPKLPSITKVR